MFARVTSFDIDTVAISMAGAIHRFQELVRPLLEQQPGYAGFIVLENEDGRGLLVSFWKTEAAAATALASGFYDEQVSKFITVYRQPPGREQFEVGLMDLPAMAPVETAGVRP